jgi:hypothetical protein
MANQQTGGSRQYAIDRLFHKLSSGGVLILSAVVIAGLCLSMLVFSPRSGGPSQSGFVVATAKASWKVSLDDVKCVSVRPNFAFVFNKNYFDDPRIFEIMKASWPEKIFYRDNRECPYVFGFNILSHTDRAIAYRGRPSVVSMAFQVCPRKPDGTVTGNGCSYKSIYLFQEVSDGIDAFALGMKAYVLPQNNGTTTVSNGTEFTIARLSFDGIGKQADERRVP